MKKKKRGERYNRMTWGGGARTWERAGPAILRDKRKEKFLTVMKQTDQSASTV